MRRHFRQITGVLLSAAIVLCCCSIARAEMLPSIRVFAPSDIRAGETFTARVAVKLPASVSYSALAVTLVWDASRLEPVGEPNISQEIFSANKDKLFDVMLLSHNDTKKGLTEIALGNWKDAKISEDAGEVTVAAQKFKVKEITGATSIEFTNDSTKTNNGTLCFSGTQEVDFRLFTPVRINIK